MMRKFLIPLAAAASALAVATPASAQWAPAPPHYGHGAPGYGYGHGAPGYGYGHPYGHARALHARINHIQREIGRLAQFRMISRGEYRSLRNQSRDIERRLRRDIRDGRGLDGREAYNLQRRIARLEYRIARDVRDGRRWAHRW